MYHDNDSIHFHLVNEPMNMETCGISAASGNTNVHTASITVVACNDSFWTELNATPATSDSNWLACSVNTSKM
jgi:hypothetical protein